MRIGFIGCGNMGGALATAVAKKCDINTTILLSDSDESKSQALAEKTGAFYSDNESIIRFCDYIFIGVKPQMFFSIVEPLRNLIRLRQDKPVLISMMAGKSAYTIAGAVENFEQPVIRIMPNTPVSVGSGMILYSLSNVTEEQEKEFKDFMQYAGRLDKIDEALMDAGSAVSGCGPAFVCQFVEALADGAVACGLPRDKALLYAAAMTEGTAKLILESGEHPATLKDAVCSPAGSTIEGVRRLEEGALRGTVIDAVKKSYEKTKELGR